MKSHVSTILSSFSIVSMVWKNVVLHAKNSAENGKMIFTKRKGQTTYKWFATLYFDARVETYRLDWANFIS